jgi:hypothetical protein
MGTIRKNSSLKRRSLRKKGGSGNDKLKLGIKDERGKEIFVPIQRDNQGNLYAEDKSAIDPHTGKKLDDAAQLRTDSGAPPYNDEWRKFDETAIKFYEQNQGKRGGGKRKKTKRKYRKGKKTRKVKKSRKRARK